MDGLPLGSTELPVSEGADETFRELSALSQGGVLYAVRTESSYELQRFDCR